MKWILPIAIFLTALLAVCQLAVWYPVLPQRVPSHFNAAGQPNSMASKQSMMIFMLVMHALMLLGMPGLGLLINRLPDSMINMPNKDYWLAPERRDASLRWMVHFIGWVGVLTSLLLIGVFQLTVWVAMGTRASINPEFWILLGGYLAILLIGCAWVTVRFSKAPPDSLLPDTRGEGC